MNTNDFEKQLRRQSIRQVPTEWRAEILRSAEADSFRDAVEHVPPGAPWWREWLWPCPQAWAGLAAVWLVIGAMQVFSPVTPDPVEARSTRPAAELVTALNERRRLLAELTDPPTSRVLSKPLPPRPRSDGKSKCVAV